MLHTATQSLDHNAQRYVHQGEGHDDNSGTARSSHHNPAHASSLQQKATDHRSSPQAGFQWQGNCSPGHNQSSRKSDAVRVIDRNFQNFDHLPGSIPSNGMPGLQECYNLGGTSQSNYVDPQPSTSLQAIMLNLSVLEHKIQQLNAILQGSVQDVDKHQMVASGVSSIIYELTVAGATLLFSCQQRGAGNPRQIIDNSSIDLQLGAAIALGSDALFNHDNEVRHIASDPDPAGDPRPGLGKSNHVLHDDFGIPSSSFQPDSMEPSDPAHGFSMLEAADREWDAYDNDNWVGNSAAAGEEHMEELNVSKEDLGSGCSFRDEDAPFERGEKYCTDRISYEIVEMDAVEILAEHTHFCEICGKGFKRDANVRMHMRAHGNQYKTHEALSKPEIPPPDSADAMRPRRYSCPYVGCRRNRNHKKFQPLKSIVCVRNHYKRIHCPKMYPCDKCNKTFSVVADLKSHAKHCGLNLWQCSCGTTFSRKDKLFGHIALFEGHTPAIPVNEFVGAGKDEGNLGETSNGNARTTSANDCSSFSKFLVDLGNNSYGNNAESLFGMESSGELKTGYGCDIPMRWD